PSRTRIDSCLPALSKAPQQTPAMTAEILRFGVLRKRHVIAHEAGPENAVEARRIQPVFGRKIHSFGSNLPVSRIVTRPPKSAIDSGTRGIRSRGGQRQLSGSEHGRHDGSIMPRL